MDQEDLAGELYQGDWWLQGPHIDVRLEGLQVPNPHLPVGTGEGGPGTRAVAGQEGVDQPAIRATVKPGPLREGQGRGQQQPRKESTSRAIKKAGPLREGPGQGRQQAMRESIGRASEMSVPSKEGLRREQQQARKESTCRTGEKSRLSR